MNPAPHTGRPQPRLTVGRIIACAIFALAFVCAAPAAHAKDDAKPDAKPDNKPTNQVTVTKPIYKVTAFKVLFDRDVKQANIDADKLLGQPLTLTRVAGVYTAPQPGAKPLTTTLKALSSDKAQQYDVTALRAIIDDLLAYLTDEAKLVGVVVLPMPSDISSDLKDVRQGRTDLTLLVRIASVGKVRTLASGDRIVLTGREDNLLHRGIRKRSPLQAGDEPRSGSIILRDVLDAYLYRLNRHPGRRVDAAVSAGTQTGEVTLDYLVAENKPWYAYFQLADSGTESTGEWRQRFGFVHNQLTASDDIFSIDYVTAGFSDSHVVTLGYTRPLTERLKLRLSALSSNFTADQVGSPLPFKGEDTSLGAALVYNFFQDGPLFIDAVGGLEYYYTTANNPVAGLDGAQSLWMGSLGLELERITDLSQLRGNLTFRGNLNQADADEFAALGRTAPDSQFLVMQYATSASFYLEPLLNRKAWEDISDPSTSTLAHELAFSARGQWAVAGHRLIPTFQAVAGGINTVRGYEQAEVASDSSLILTAEYRFHVPRIFGIKAPKRTQLFDRPFRVAPESVYGRPDWDLILKAFVDYAYMDVTNELAFESDDTLLSAGVGLEVSIKNNISFRADWAVALEDAGTANARDNRFHFVLTLLY